jgi:hypothetical protein
MTELNPIDRASSSDLIQLDLFSPYKREFEKNTYKQGQYEKLKRDYIGQFFKVIDKQDNLKM